MKTSIHLKNLTTFRAIAAFVVIISHIERFKHRNQVANWYDFPFLKNTGGHTAVVMFFALSGFLITYLLLQEKKQTTNVSLRKFYLRRILRVWPLYFLILLSSYLLLDYKISFTTLVLSLTFLPNIADGLMIRFEPCPPLWSLGVEEQFYLTWPLLIKYSNHAKWIVGLIFLVFTLIPFIIIPKLESLKFTIENINIVKQLLLNLKFNCLASGAFFAILLHQKSKIILFFNQNKMVAYVCFLLPFCLWFSSVKFAYCSDEIYSVLFSIAIAIGCSSTHIPNLDIKPFEFLGGISYGLYMFHYLILEFIFRWNFIPKENLLIYNVSLYGLTVGVTILFAWVSFNYIERPFLSLKKRYNLIQ